MDRNLQAELAAVFVDDMPVEPQTVKGGQVNPMWERWQGLFSTWLSQAQKVLKLTDRLYVNRVGSMVTVTGTIGENETVEGVYPAGTFNVGVVVFSKEGYIRNYGPETGVSVTFIAGR